MTTARDIIYSALEEIGARAPGEDVPAADAFTSLGTLNDMLAMWSNENLACFAMLAQTFSTVVSQASYSIGPLAADITSARPLKIEQAWSIDGSWKVPMRIVLQPEWELLDSIAGTPTRLFYDPQVANGIIYLSPTPNLVTSIGILSYLQFTQFTNLTDDVVLPLGYVGALKKNLAVELAPFFSKTPQPVTVALAAEYKGRLKAKNIQLDVATFDPAIAGRGAYNVLTDGY